MVDEAVFNRKLAANRIPYNIMSVGIFTVAQIIELRVEKKIRRKIGEFVAGI